MFKMIADVACRFVEQTLTVPQTSEHVTLKSHMA